MKVKDAHIKTNLKVIDPKTGNIGYYKGNYNGGVFIGTNNSNKKFVYPIPVTQEEFLEWEVANHNERVTIGNSYNRRK